LEKHGANVLAELRAGDQLDEGVGGVDAVATDPAGEHAVEAGAAADSTDDADVAAMLVEKRSIVEAHDVGDGLHRGAPFWR
jgi:hypothetical protein